MISKEVRQYPVSALILLKHCVMSVNAAPHPRPLPTRGRGGACFANGPRLRVLGRCALAHSLPVDVQKMVRARTYPAVRRL